MMVYDQALKNGKGLGTHVGHGDSAFDTQGREVYVFQDSGTDYISMVDLATGSVTQLTPIDFSHTAISLHFSGRAFGKPGWALVSTTDDNRTTYTWMDNQAFALELASNGRIVRLAHDHTLVDNKQEHDYWAEPHGSVNRDFTKVLFTSNWGQSGTEGVDMYMVALPANAITSKIGPIDTTSAVSSSGAIGIPGFEGALALAALGVGEAFRLLCGAYSAGSVLRESQNGRSCEALRNSDGSGIEQGLLSLPFGTALRAGARRLSRPARFGYRRS